jgi:two-component system NtrC family sensor kinase
MNDQNPKKKNPLAAISRLLNSFSSIYGQVVKVIGLLTLFLALSFGIIFWAINKEYMENTIQQNGNNVTMFVEGALYEHMLENNKMALRHTLDIINRMPGIEDVNMYDANDNLAYSSSDEDSLHYHNPNCKDCHLDINSLFPRMEKSFRIINMDNECEMSDKENDYRLLMIKTPILNEPSCYTNLCHAHKESEESLGSLVIRIPLEELDAQLNRSVLLALVTTLILVVAILMFTQRKIKRPLKQIIEASEAVAMGDRDTRLDIRSDQLNDIRMLSSAFNKMLDNLHSAREELENWSQQLEYKVRKKSEEISEMQNELIHIERIASLGKLSSSVAHEINNPLSGVLTYTKLVHKLIRKLDIGEMEKESMSKYLFVIEDETKRCGDIVKGLLDFSKSDKQDFRPIHLHRLLKETYVLIEHQMKIESILFQTDFSAGKDLIMCNGNQVKQACIAILMNASEAVLDNGVIQIRTTNPDKANIRVDIIDNGVGIANEDIPQIFEPFFSTKEKASGIGLGLAIAHGIVKNHDGKIEVESLLGKGTTISIILPLTKSEN